MIYILPGVFNEKKKNKKKKINKKDLNKRKKIFLYYNIISFLYYT